MAGGSGPERPGTGSEFGSSESGSTESGSTQSGAAPARGRPGPPAGVIVAAFAILGVVLVAGAVVVGVRLAGDYSGDGSAWGPITPLTATPVDLPDRDRSGTSTSSRTPTSSSTTSREASALCDARAINADLGYPDAGSRIISCENGWAVMASAHSGDPFWVEFRGGRWRAVNDISMYLSTCPDEAISRGAPDWIAQKHLGDCPSLNPRTTHTRSSTRPPAPTPAPRPTPTATARPTVPTATVAPSTSSVPSTTSVSVTPTTAMTTTTAPASSTAAGAEVAQ